MNTIWTAWLQSLHNLADVWTTAMWRGIWQGGMAFLLAWALCRALSRLTASVRCGLWRLAYLKMLVAFVCATSILLPLLPSRLASGVDATPAFAPILSQPSSPVASKLGASVAQTSPPAAVPPAALLPASVALLLAWLVGAVWVGYGMARSARAGARLRRECAAVSDPDIIALRDTLARSMNLRRPPTLLSHPTYGPLTLGIRRPAVVLPHALIAPEQRAALPMILAHELAHVQRRDLAWNLLPASAHLLFWFHPLVWLANREWQVAQEMACDVRALQTTNVEAGDYGALLVRLAKQQRAVRAHGLAMSGMAETSGALQRRLKAMKHIAPRSKRQLGLAALTLSALALLGLIPWQVVASRASSEQLLFVSDRDGAQTFHIYTMNLDGSGAKRVTKGSAIELEPVWSPDHRRIAYSVADPKLNKINLYVMDANGANSRRLTDCAPTFYALSPAWSPDGGRLVYTLWQPRQPADENGEAQVMSALHVIDAGGGHDRALTDGMWALWSPDGKRIAYTGIVKQSRREASMPIAPALLTMNADGSDVKTITGNAFLDGWSSDGKRLVYEDPITTTTYLAGVDGGKPERLLAHPGFVDYGHRWAANGKRLIFTRTLSPDGDTVPRKAQMYVMDSDGSHARPLTDGKTLNFMGVGTGLNAWLNWIQHTGQ